MNKRGENGKSAGVMLAIFLILMAAYIIYIMLLHPWERRALLTVESMITVNVVDCDSGYPINGARVNLYNNEGIIVEEATTTNGSIVFNEFPDCFIIKASYDAEQIREVCTGNGEHKIINFCYDHPEANPNIIYYQDTIGFIGGTTGEEVSNKSFSNVLLSYPLNNVTITYPSSFIYSNILWSEGMKINLTNINESYTKAINFEFNMGSKRGDPTTRVYVNGQLLFDNKVSTNELVSVSIPKQSLNETMNFEVKCDFNGVFFWSTQDCNLTNIRVTQEFYSPEKTSQEFPFTISTIESQANSLGLSFTSVNNVIGGVTASINNVQVFDSNSLLAKNYTASITVEGINFNNDTNTLRFNANPGAEALLRNIKLSFTAPVTPKEKEVIEFAINNNTMDSLDSATINFFLSNIYLNGELLFKVNDITYVTTVYKAGWNSFTIDKEDLANDNVLEISAITGRFEMDELRITYE
ncbi:MAG: hypothetical protein WC307_03170 [Candidatus Nanoarchaeia archaeon]|jgi:hypothetical protein